MKRLAVLGSTGSIGRQALDVVRAFPDQLQVLALACGNNTALLREQAAEFQPEFVWAEAAPRDLDVGGARSLPLEEIASHPDVDTVVVATAGKAGLAPTLAAIRAGKEIALANKEVLVMAGGVVVAESRRHGARIVPVDSEHSAIWQCLRGEEGNGIRRLILTASGGPFRTRSLSELAAVTPEDALNHPTWTMGAKVTIDSATLMNKGLEIIEAHWLFDVAFSDVEVLIHPQSVVHSMVEFLDGTIKAQLSLPDMRLPIQYALMYPDRRQGPFHERVDFTNLRCFDFERVDAVRFPCLTLAVQAGERGGTYPAVLSAADEVAVQLFLDKRIGFQDIARVVERTLEQHVGVRDPGLEDILAADAWARENAGYGF